MPVGSPHDQVLNWAKLDAHLASYGLLFDACFSPKQFEAGFGNLNFLIKLDGQHAVLRRPPFGKLPPGANDMAREFRVIQGLNQVYPLVPSPIHFCDDNDVLGAPFFIMEYVSGTVIGESISQDILQSYASSCDADGATTGKIGALLADNLIRTLAQLHQLDPALAGLDTLGKPQGFIARTIKGWNMRANLAWSDRAPDTLNILVDWLGKHAPEDHKGALIHNDFKLDNVILDTNTLQPLAVIDWDMCTRGAPLYDLAVMLSYWTESNDPVVMHTLRQMPTAHHGFPTREQAAQHYSSITNTPLHDFTFFRVLATLRIAGIFKQLHRRFETGTSNNKQLARLEGLGDDLLSFGVDIAHGRAY